MFYNNTTINRLAIAILFTGILLLSGNSFAQQDSLNSTSVTISGNNLPMEEIVREVTKQTGYTVQISEALLERKVVGDYKNVEIDRFFQRVLKDQNVMQVFDQEEKILKIISVDKNTSKVLAFNAKGAGNLKDDILDDEGGEKTLQELLQERDYAEVDEGMLELDGEPGRKISDLKDEQYAVSQTHDLNKQELDGERGKTYQDLLDEKESNAIAKVVEPQVLDDQSGETIQALLQKKEEYFKNHDIQTQGLDDEPGKTLQDLLDARDEYYNSEKQN